jgi:hypothetical protein
MAKSSSRVTSSKFENPTHSYADDEIGRAKRDFRLWALKHAAELGANTDLTRDPIDMLQSTFWHFVVFEATPKPVERTTKVDTLPGLKRAIVEVLNQLKASASELENVPGFFEMIEMRNSGIVTRKSPQCVFDAANALNLLLCEIETRSNAKKIPRSAPRKARGQLVRNALRFPARAGGWWPAEPSSTDMAALSILTSVAFNEFEDDFAKRRTLARQAAGGRGQPVSDLKALICNEEKRCHGLMVNCSKNR